MPRIDPVTKRVVYNDNAPAVSPNTQQNGIQNIKNAMGVSGPMTYDQYQQSGQTPNHIDVLKDMIVGGKTATQASNNNITQAVTSNSIPSQNANTQQAPVPGQTTQNIPTAQTNNWQDSQQYKDLYGQIQSSKDNISKMTTDNQAQQTQTTDAYNAARDAKLAAVRAAINASKSKFQTVIDNAPEQFQGQRNQVAAQNDLNNLALRRSLGNMGYTPNEDLSAIREGNATNSANQQITQYDIAEKKTIQDAQNDITNLEAQGKFEEASAVNDYATKSLESINNLKQQLQTNLTAANASYGNDLKGLLEYSTGRQDRVEDVNYRNTLFRANQAELKGSTLDGGETLQKKSVDSTIGSQNIQNSLTQVGIDKGKQELKVLPDQLKQALNIGGEQLKGLQTENQYKPDQLKQNLDLGKLQIASETIGNQMKQYQIDKILPAQYEQLMTAIKSGDLDNATKQIQNSFLPEKLKSDISLTLANAYQSTQAGNHAGDAYAVGMANNAVAQQNANTNAAHAGDSASIARDRLNWEKDPTNPDNIYKIAQSDASTNKGQPTEANILNQVKAMGQSGKYEPTQLREYIANSAITPEAKARIANQMGIPKN